MSAGILLMVDGVPIDLADVSWIQVAPCGCTSGVTIAYSNYGTPALVVATAEAAADSMYSSKAERKQAEDRGFVFRPIRRTDLGNMNCEHEPRWGYEHPPRPEGMAWAAGGYHNERTKVMHLAPTASVRTDDFDPDREHWTASALCGVEKRHWTAEWHATDGKVECTRCVGKAAKP